MEISKKFDSSCHELVDKAHQPKLLVLPKQKYGNINVFSMIGLRNGHAWLHYNEFDDSACCFTCTTAIKEKKVKAGNMDACFISSGYTNWKDVTCTF